MFTEVLRVYSFNINVVDRLKTFESRVAAQPLRIIILQAGSGSQAVCGLSVKISGVFVYPR